MARTGAETTVVFDAANLTSRPVVAAPRGVKVVFSPPGVIADDVIRDLVAAEPSGRTVVVVTDDQEVIRDARAAGRGCFRFGSRGAARALAFAARLPLRGVSAARGLGRRSLAGAGSRLAGAGAARRPHSVRWGSDRWRRRGQALLAPSSLLPAPSTVAARGW